MQAKPDAKEHRGYLTVNVPLSVMERLEPFALRRIKSKFVTAAITAALDQYDAEQATKGREREPA